MDIENKHQWEGKNSHPNKKKTKKKVLSTFLYFTSLLVADHHVANISRVEGWSNTRSDRGGNASPTSCGLTPDWIPCAAQWSSFSSGQINGSVSVSRSPCLPLWVLYCLLFSLMVSPERGLRNNNSSHDKREHMQPYSAYTLHGITHSTHRLTRWIDKGSGPWPAWEEWSEVCMCLWVSVCLLGGGFGWEEKELGEEMEEEEEGEFWSSLLLFHNDAIHSYETAQTAHWADSHWNHWTHWMDRNWTSCSSERQRRGGGTVTWTDNLWFKLFTSAILYLQQNDFPMLTMTNCALYRLNKWIVFVYMETQQHSWKALTNQAQRGLKCRSFPKERPAAHSG